jgi:hypothetical protein
MSRNKKLSTTDSSVEDITAAFLSVLDNDDVITKIATVLSTSINLILTEKINPLITKLDTVIAEHKNLLSKVNKIDQENAKLKQLNDGLQTTVESLSVKVSLLEQSARKNNIVITGVAETYAERTTAAADGEIPVVDDTRDDTVAKVCAVLKETCNVNVSAADILTATRLQSKHTGPRPLLVSFHSSSVRATVIRARRPKQQLKYQGTPIYINDHLTKYTADLAYKARMLVKQREAHSTWVRNGLVFIKWTATSRPSQIQKMTDFD